MWNINYVAGFMISSQQKTIIMIAVIQRVKNASVTIKSKLYSEIGNGLLIFLGVTHNDTKEDAEWLANKIVNLRIFDDNNGVMNLSVKELNYDILTVSQFTLHAKTKKGNRPSYIEAAKPPLAPKLYEHFVLSVDNLLLKQTQTGSFGEYMKVNLCNDGPVTILIDTHNKK